MQNNKKKKKRVDKSAQLPNSLTKCNCKFNYNLFNQIRQWKVTFSLPILILINSLLAAAIDLNADHCWRYI